MMHTQPLFAQTDSTDKKEDRKKTLLLKMVDSFKKDSTEIDQANELERNDKMYEMYEGLIIRNIEIQRLPFGTASNDTTKKLKNTLINIANKVHYLSKTKVIRRNLFLMKMKNGIYHV